MTTSPKVVREVSKIDPFHYDSDRSVGGRKLALNCVREKLHKESVIIFVDIQTDFYFHDMVAQSQQKYLLFEFEGKCSACSVVRTGFTTDVLKTTLHRLGRMQTAARRRERVAGRSSADGGFG